MTPIKIEITPTFECKILSCLVKCRTSYIGSFIQVETTKKIIIHPVIIKYALIAVRLFVSKIISAIIP